MSARRRRRALAWIAGAMLAVPALGSAPYPAAAQMPHEGVAGAAPDVPTGDATLRVRLVDAEQPSSVAGAEVILYALTADGEPGLRRSQADGEGHTAFEGISASPGVVYLVGTRVAGVPFGTRTGFAEGEREREVVIEVSTPSTDTRAVSPGPLEIRLERGCGDVRIRHVQALEVRGAPHVIHVPPGQREGATPLFEVQLPEGASEIEAPLGAGAESFERDGRTLRFWGPLYPNDAKLEFGYAVRQDHDGPLAIGFPRGSGPLTVLAPQGGVDVASDALTEGAPVSLPDGAQRVFEGEALAPGASLALRLGVPEVPEEARVRVTEARIWIELDDAAMQVSEVHLLEVEGGAGLPASARAPLLCLPLPEGAQDLRLSNAALEMGLSRDAAGALAMKGPLPPGESSVALRYQLPALSEPAVFERSFARPVPLLTLLVADTGLVPHTTRLHGRRPVRTEDLAYLYLEGFGVEAGEPVRVAFERIALGGGLSPLVSGGFVFLSACAALFFLVSPLRERGAQVEVDVAPERSTEREATYHAIEALDEDFETGKLSAEDHARMREALRAKAVALLQEEQEAQARARQAPEPREGASEAKCPSCGTGTRPDDRFCAHCGTALAGREPVAS